MAGPGVARALMLTLVLATGASCARGYEPSRADGAAMLRAGHVPPVQLHHEVKGDEGDPILFIHGFGASTYTWRHLSECLSRERAVILIDLKGFGRSPKPMDDRYALADQAVLVHDFILEHDLRDLTLIGHSMGGGIALLVAQKLLEADDEYLNSLVLIGSVAYPQQLPWFMHLLRTPILSDLALSVLPAELQVRTILGHAFYDDRKITDDAVAAYAAALKSQAGRHALLRTAEQIIPPDLHELVPRYKTINVPTLLVWGRNDEIVPLEMGKHLDRDLPNSCLVVLDETGHFPHEEQPKKTVAILADFLGVEAKCREKIR